jgi:hypothetical protein
MKAIHLEKPWVLAPETGFLALHGWGVPNPLSLYPVENWLGSFEVAMGTMKFRRLARIFLVFSL